jgi:hypothetical protein
MANSDSLKVRDGLWGAARAAAAIALTLAVTGLWAYLWLQGSPLS